MQPGPLTKAWRSFRLQLSGFPGPAQAAPFIEGSFAADGSAEGVWKAEPFRSL